MKRVFLLLAFVATVFIGCKDDKKDDVIVIDNLAEKVIGKWMPSEMGGVSIPTNDKVVFTFESATKALISASMDGDGSMRVAESAGDRPDLEPKWDNKIEWSVVIKDNVITITNQEDAKSQNIIRMAVSSINEKEMKAEMDYKRIENGKEVFNSEGESISVIYTRVKEDYSKDIIGMWEGRSTGADGSVYDDGESHRWEYLSDGTYRYYEKVDGLWQLSKNVMNEYFVDGTLLCTRWQDAGEGEKIDREWWEIESIKDGVMKWKAVREKEDGSTYVASFEMTYVNIPTEEEVSRKILGKWMVKEMNGVPALTNEKAVYTFESENKAYMSASFDIDDEEDLFGDGWSDRTELSYIILDNKINLMQYINSGIFINEMTVGSISDTELDCILRILEIDVDNFNVDSMPPLHLVMEKVTADYSEDIVGTWKGHMSSEISEYGDEEEHCWRFLDDSTYYFYCQTEGEKWVLCEDEYADYFVDGNLLCTRWKNVGEGKEENREWWEIASIEDDVMVWTALRRKEDGSTYTASFEMTRMVPPSKDEIMEHLIGMWMIKDIKGVPALTNDKAVLNIISEDLAYMSASFDLHENLGKLWSDDMEMEVWVTGNSIFLSADYSDDVLFMDELIVMSIDDESMECVVHHTEYDKETYDELLFFSGGVAVFEKKDVDLSEDIIGAWEGQLTSSQDEFGDGKPHRWEFYQDGTYQFYRQDDQGGWACDVNSEAEYFVKANLLCFRWKNEGNDTEFREWWEIESIQDGVMKWKAVRENKDGSYYTATYEMSKLMIE